MTAQLVRRSCTLRADDDVPGRGAQLTIALAGTSALERSARSTARAGAGLSASERRAERSELAIGQSGFDTRKQLPLLAPDMAVDEPAKLMKLVERWLICCVDRPDALTDRDVVA